MGAYNPDMLLHGVLNSLLMQFVTPPPLPPPTPRRVRPEMLSLRAETYIYVGISPASRARGEYLRTHFKNMREVAAALTGEIALVSGFRSRI